MSFSNRSTSIFRRFVSSLIVLLILTLLGHDRVSCERVEILMSNVSTQKEDAYMCTSYKLSDDQQYITNIQPLTNAQIAHHMFAFGCEKPASSQNSWSCESLVCQGPKTILFAWGRDAPELRLPEDVAFKVGPKTSYKYIVVNIHYLSKVTDDRSGLAITVGDTPRRYQAGIMLMVANYINIPPNTKKHSTPFSCKYAGKPLQVFAYRVHAHMHGDVNTAYRVRDHEWVELARGDPQWPQAFYPVSTSGQQQIELRDQDALVGVCTYHNDEARHVYAGATHNDEMCNVYLMYYAESTDGVMEMCTGSAYPSLEAIIPDQAYVKPPSPNVSKYTLIENWYDPKTIALGQIGGIEVNQKTDTLVVFHRGSQIWQADSFNSEYRFNTRKYTTIPTDTIVIINRSTGKLISSWGANQFLMPHGLTLDSDGNIWITDVGRHQVLKIDANTHEVLLELGEKLVPGSDRKHFCQPADVAVLKSGEFFVADDYCNSRIVKFSKQGEFLAEWSSEDESMPSHFFVPHSLALNEANNLLCVADRENFRVQCFDLKGNFLHESLANQVGPIYAVSFAASNASVLYAVNGYNSRTTATSQNDKKIYLLSTKTGNLVGSINLAPDVRTPHDLALADDASEIYIANLNPPAVFKYSLVNFNFNKVGDKKNSKSSGAKTGDKDNFRTSMFIMGFLVVPLVLVIIVATIVRLKNVGKLRRLKLSGALGGVVSGVGSAGGGGGVETRWKRGATKNGFTRLNQESEGEEAESLNKPRRASGNSEDDDDASEDDTHMPTMSKA